MTYAFIQQVHAHDADDGNFGKIKYYMTSDHSDIFRLDPDSGILYPRQSLKGMRGKPTPPHLHLKTNKQKHIFKCNFIISTFIISNQFTLNLWPNCVVWYS